MYQDWTLKCIRRDDRSRIRLLLLSRDVWHEEPDRSLDTKQDDEDGLEHDGREFLREGARDEGKDGRAALSERGDERDRGTVLFPRQQFCEERHHDRVQGTDDDADERHDDGVPDEAVGEPDGELCRHCGKSELEKLAEKKRAREERLTSSASASKR